MGAGSTLRVGTRERDEVMILTSFVCSLSCGGRQGWGVGGRGSKREESLCFRPVDGKGP